jgi:hypothetical protein
MNTAFRTVKMVYRDFRPFADLATQHPFMVYGNSNLLVDICFDYQTFGDRTLQHYFVYQDLVLSLSTLSFFFKQTFLHFDHFLLPVSLLILGDNHCQVTFAWEMNQALVAILKMGEKQLKSPIPFQ